MEVEVQTWHQFKNSLTEKNPYRANALIVIVGLALINWFLEILKWRLVVSHIQRISIGISFKQSLASFTTSLATPSRIGDYGAKAAHFPPNQRKNILLLNLFSNSTQMLVTTILGLIGYIYISENYTTLFSSQKLWGGLIVISLGILGLYYFRNKTLLIRGLSFKSVIYFFKKLSLKIKVGSLLLSLARYAAFSLLFYSLLGFFGANTAFVPTFFIITAMYLFVSILPSFFILDVMIRGGVAVWLFSILGIPEPTVLCTVLAMWILNFAFPALLGSYYVMTFKPQAAV